MLPGEMRRCPRHPLRFNVLYDDGQTYNVGVVDDVSETGMLIECANPLPVGTVLRLEPVDDDGEELFEVDARVVRHMNSDELIRRVKKTDAGRGLVGLGLEFVDTSEPARAAIHDMIDRLRARPAGTDPYLG